MSTNDCTYTIWRIRAFYPPQKRLSQLIISLWKITKWSQHFTPPPSRGGSFPPLLEFGLGLKTYIGYWHISKCDTSRVLTCTCSLGLSLPCCSLEFWGHCGKNHDGWMRNQVESTWAISVEPPKSMSFTNAGHKSEVILKHPGPTNPD